MANLTESNQGNVGRNACRRDASRPAAREPESLPHRQEDPLPEVLCARHRVAAPGFCSGPLINCKENSSLAKLLYMTNGLPRQVDYNFRKRVEALAKHSNCWISLSGPL